VDAKKREKVSKERGLPKSVTPGPLKEALKEEKTEGAGEEGKKHAPPYSPGNWEKDSRNKFPRGKGRPQSCTRVRTLK